MGGTLLKDGEATTLPPSMSYSDSTGLFVLAWANAPNGELRVALSENGKDFISYGALPGDPGPHTSDSFGLDCSSTTERCLIAYGNARVAGDPIRVLELALRDVNTAPRVDWDEPLKVRGLPGHCYGVDVTYLPDNPNYLVAWRDRGRASILMMQTVPLGGGSPAVDFQAFDTIHSAPRLTLVDSDVLLTASYSDRYNQ